ncbi:MAG: hypothetical protein RJB61_1654 [Actinomycetota bacterium]
MEPFNDSVYFSEQARQLAKGTLFREIFVDQPGAEHGPLTSVLMAPVSWPDSYLMWQRLITTLCGIATVVVLVVLVRRISGRLEAAIAAGVAASYPNLWASDGLAMSESVSMLCVALVLIAAHRVLVTGAMRRRAWFGLGVLAGVAALARSELLLLVPGLMAAAWWNWTTERRSGAEAASAAEPVATAVPLAGRSLVARVALIATGAALALAPWTIFNASRFEGRVLLTTNEGGTLLGSYCSDTFEGADIGGWSVLCLFRDPDYKQDEEPSLRSERQRAMALEFAQDHVAELPVVVAARVARTLDLYGLSTLVAMDVGEERYEWASWAGIFAFWVLAPLAIMGWRRGSVSRSMRRLLTMPIVVTAFTTVVFYGAHRIRSTAEPSIVVLASLGAGHLVRNWLARLRAGKVENVNSQSGLGSTIREQVGASWRALSDRRRMAVVASLYGAASLIATGVSSGYAADNRFEIYQSPWSVLRRTLDGWDPTRGLGGPREDVWLPTLVPAAVLRSLGLSAASTQRAVAALLIAAFGIGVVALVRRLYEWRVGAVHVLAGAFAMSGPFTASFLVPTNLFAMSVASVWLTVVVIDGLRGEQPWRDAALAALLVLAAGNADLPGLAYSLVMLVPTVAYLLWVERSTSLRRLCGWAARSFALVAACAAWPLAKAWSARDELAARLAETELPSTSATTSSWSESIRGLGNWLSYFAESGRLAKPQTSILLTSPVVILATFALPAVALGAIWRTRWRGRVLLGFWMIAGTAVMVGAYSDAPFGSLVEWSFDANRLLTSFRNTYKAGTAVAVGTAVLAAVGVVHAWHALGPSRRRRMALSGCAAALTVAAAWPLASGGIFHPTERTDALPAYWREAADHLNGLPEPGRSLIVPASSQTYYRWGYVGDDIFDALFRRPHATATGWMVSTASGHDAIEALTLAVQEPGYRPGTIAALAQRLGITEIVIRNDVDWRRQGVARPAAYRALRSDPGLQLTATFGQAGLAVIGEQPDDLTAYESTLPAVEIYSVRSPVQGLGLVPGPPIVVAGDARSWAAAVQGGLVEAADPLSAAGALDDDELTSLLRQGAPVLVTDSARRRQRNLARHEVQLSPTLAEGQELDRPIRQLFAGAGPGNESTAWFADALRLEGAYITFGGFRYDRRASLAFDENPATMWAVPSSGVAGVRAALTVTLREPTVIDAVDVLASVDEQGASAVRQVTVELAGVAEPVVVELDAQGVGSAVMPRVPVTQLTLVISGTTDVGPEVGFREVRLTKPSGEAIDLVEYIDVPSRVVDRLADRSESSTPIAYSFRRSERPVTSLNETLGASAGAEESVLARRFRVPFASRLILTGALRVASGARTVLDASSGCVDVGLRIGAVPSEMQRILVRRDESIPAHDAAPLEGMPRSVGFSACMELVLGPGTHFLRTLPGSAVDAVWMRPQSWSSDRGADSGVLSWERVGPDRVVGTIEGGAGGILVLRESYDDRWTLEIDGRSVAPLEGGGANIWFVTPTDADEFTLTMRDGRVMRGAFAASMAGAAVCVLLLILSRRRRRGSGRAADAIPAQRSDIPRLGLPPRALGTALAVAAAAGTLLVGPVAIAAAVGVGIMLAVRPASLAATGAPAPALTALAGVVMLLDLPPVSMSFPRSADGASDLVAVALVFALCHLALVVAADRSSAP